MKCLGAVSRTWRECATLPHSALLCDALLLQASARDAARGGCRGAMIRARCAVRTRIRARDRSRKAPRCRGLGGRQAHRTILDDERAPRRRDGSRAHAYPLTRAGRPVRLGARVPLKRGRSPVGSQPVGGQAAAGRGSVVGRVFWGFLFIESGAGVSPPAILQASPA